MTDAALQTLSLSDIRRLKEDGHLPVAQDAPEADINDPAFWAQAKVRSRLAGTSVHLRLEAGVYDVFLAKTGGKGHIRKMQDVLAASMRAQRR